VQHAAPPHSSRPIEQQTTSSSSSLFQVISDSAVPSSSHSAGPPPPQRHQPVVPRPSNTYVAPLPNPASQSSASVSLFQVISDSAQQ
jgi:hypothetical protein